MGGPSGRLGLRDVNPRNWLGEKKRFFERVVTFCINYVDSCLKSSVRPVKVKGCLATHSRIRGLKWNLRKVCWPQL